MSEIKRATLISFGSDKSDDKKQKVIAKTLRISFILPESNEGTCPVYNYKEELAAAKKKKEKCKTLNNGRQTNGLDPFDEDDDDVRRIAQEMEAKYGMGPPTKKKRKGRKDDYADIGMGYDESDSFIDNTDGYDEMIPQNVTTLHGGFYINCGALEFKTDDEVSSEVSSSSSSSSSDDEDDEDAPEKPSRKRILESSDTEGEIETDKNEKSIPAEKKQKLNVNIMNGEINKKKKLELPIKIHKHSTKKLHSDEKKKKEMLKEKKEDINNPINEVTDKVDNVMKENKKPSTTASVNDLIESVVKASDNNNKLSEAEDKKDLGKENVQEPSVASHNKPVPSSEGENSRDSSGEQKIEMVQLPENLPDNIMELVVKIKEAAAKNIENNSKIFSSNINVLLLSLERKCRCLGRQSRSKIYQHLGPFMKCKKETLTRRAKNLVIEEDSNKLQNLIKELKSNIELVMPPLLENYEKESQKIVQKKFSRESAENEENKQLRMPKRRFTWTEDIKKLLKDIITLRKRCYILQGKMKEALEIALNLFIKSEIQTLWPEGWMSMATLLKVCNSFSDKKTASPNKNIFSSNKDNAKQLSDHIIKEAHKEKLKEKSATTSNIINTELPVTGVGAKEMQKLANNSMLSITPITSTSPESSKPQLQKNDITINKIDNDKALPVEIPKNSGLSIIPTPISSDITIKAEENISKLTNFDNSKVTSTTESCIKIKTDTIIKPVKTELPIKSSNPQEGLIKPVKTETLLRPSLQERHEKVTFIHMPQKEFKPENLSIKPNKPPTDHKIENIIKPSKPENLSKPKIDQLKPENLSRPKHDAFYRSKDVKSDLRKSASPPDIIVLDDSISDIRSDSKMLDSNQKNDVIDLTSSDLKRKPGPKSKTKYYDANMIKPVKSASFSSDSTKHKTLFTGNAGLENLVQEFLVEAENYYGNMKKSKEGVRPPSNLLPNKSHSDGDDIQKVMEDLKVLQKLSTPTKSDSLLTSSPVSVIAFNKNFSTKSNLMSAPQSIPKQETKTDIASGFQEAFSRQFLNDLRNITNHSSSASPKNYNSAHSSSGSHQEKYYSNANNNYSQQSASKYKNNFPPPPSSGSYNLMDDMLANFITEYAYPKAANHKSKQPPQK